MAHPRKRPLLSRLGTILLLVALGCSAGPDRRQQEHSVDRTHRLFERLRTYQIHVGPIDVLRWDAANPPKWREIGFAFGLPNGEELWIVAGAENEDEDWYHETLKDCRFRFRGYSGDLNRQNAEAYLLGKIRGPSGGIKPQFVQHQRYVLTKSMYASSGAYDSSVYSVQEMTGRRRSAELFHTRVSDGAGQVVRYEELRNGNLGDLPLEGLMDDLYDFEFERDARDWSPGSRALQLDETRW